MKFEGRLLDIFRQRFRGSDCRRRPQADEAKELPKKGLKAQVSMEFMQSVGFLLLIFVVLTPIIYSAYQNNRNSQLGSEAQVVADQLSSEINTAVAVGRGYRRIFTLPKSLGDSSDYAMAIYPSEQLVVVNWTEVNSASAAIVTGNVTAKALDAPRKGDNAIFNNDGIIEIS